MAIADNVESQRRFFNSNETKPVEFRLKQLKKLKEVISLNQHKIFEALHQDLKNHQWKAILQNLP